MTQITDLYGNDDIEAMYQAALRVPLAEKVQLAILMVQTYEQMALNLSEDGFYVCFSGGKDSIVMAKLFEMAGVKYKLHTNNVTLDPPELVQFVKQHYPETTWHHVGQNLPAYMAKHGKGLPTRMSRWCCEIYKEQGGAGCFVAIGVRAPESPRRKGLWSPVKQHYKNKTPIMSPILYWTDEDIWTFIRGNEMPYCKLYDEGFKRLGCIGCPMNGGKRKGDFARWPKYQAMWKRGTEKLYRDWAHVPRKDGKERGLAKFKDADDLWAWWMDERSVNDTDNADCQMFLW